MSWLSDYSKARRAAVMEAIGADLCAKFPFADIMPNTGTNKWFVRIERTIHRDMHRGGAPVQDFDVVFSFVAETLAIAQASDRVSDADSYSDLLFRAETAALALGAAQDTLRFGPISTEFVRTDNGYRAIMRFESQQSLNIADS